MKLVTAQQMRDLEQRADASGNSYAQMMERAGTLAAQAIMEKWDVHAKKILVLVGPGNNGGDGLVCARVLHDAGASVRVYLWNRASDENDANWQQCVQRAIPLTYAQDDSDFSQLREKAAHADFVIDALLGTGVARPIEGNLKALLETLRVTVESGKDKPLPLQQPNNPTLQPPSRPTIIAIDLPTGLNPNTGALDAATVGADLTVTFAFPKIGHYLFPGANAVGELVVADIDIPREWAQDLPLNVATASEIRAWLPTRARDANKGTFGKTMLACGSLHYTGAPALAARAAGRAGTGLVTLALTQTIHAIVASKLEETTFLPLPDHSGTWRPRAANELLAVLWDNPFDALLVGCGLGRADSTRVFLERLLEQLPTLEYPPPLVLDADALNLLAEIPEWWTRFSFSTPPILTPHPGEMARLLGTSTPEVQAKRIESARDAAQQWNAIVVLKGAFTIVAAPNGETTVLPFANAALATAGTGDVLAGTLASFLAQLHAQGKRVENFDVPRAAYNAAILGAYVHALAGEIAAREIGAVGLVAGDLISRLPQAIKRVKSDE